MIKNNHNYTLRLTWEGLPDQSNTRNDRLYNIAIPGKKVFSGSADKAFFGDPSKYNPEDLLLASLSACHMMSYFHLCRKHDIEILSYTDNPKGNLKVNIDESGQFTSVELYPNIIITGPEHEKLANTLHIKAGKLCFIANSCNFPISYHPTIKVDNILLKTQ